ncbi:hypothetical protein [uncultured Helicobacter sp.]|uniref:hypothetical protein n=1 Tax=uncultured Helicobacter sp. TaxID=175537 RepID=UPI001C3BAABC|nr:hypothetical protein [Candidatus Helicobacter avicola]
MHPAIKDFLHTQHLLALSVLQPYRDLQTLDSQEVCEPHTLDSVWIHSANCFYAFDETNYALVFKSEPHTRHIQLATRYPNVSATIATNTLKIAKIKGLQIQARFTTATQAQEEIYYARFPFARLGAGEIYALEILYAKYTNNALGLSKKLEFHKNP